MKALIVNDACNLKLTGKHYNFTCVSILNVLHVLVKYVVGGPVSQKGSRLGIYKFKF